ncbi:MAG: GH92 family glycosyl hydrolase [Marinoscillum sp.]
MILFRKHVFLLINVFVFIAACDIIQQEEPSEPVDLVYPLLDTENSRWFFFSSANRPFGMVNLSPDTEIDGAWNSGYRYQTDTVKGFSHIHAWQLSGLSVMPVSLEEDQPDIIIDYYSYFDHRKETVKPGYHRLELDRYGIVAELTSTKRVGFHRYTFSGEDNNAIIINLGGQLGPSEITGGSLKRVNDRVFTGSLVNAPTFRRIKEAKVFFRIEFNCDVTSLSESDEKGNYLLSLKTGSSKKVKMKVAISYTSIENAAYNLYMEMPQWNFDQIVEDSRKDWNQYLGRIQVEGGTHDQRRRFYTDLWHALQGRRTISDVNGYYPDNTGEVFQVKRLPLGSNGKPLFDHYNSDSFWGAQWTINTLWHLVYPEISEAFVNSLLQYYKDGGLVPRGPSGGNYTYVMTGASATPFIVSAYQKGLRGFDVEMAYEALKKNHMAGGIMAKAGYEHKTSLGGGLEHYLKKGYVPFPIPEGEFGSHQDGASLTLEYAYQDWTLAQMALALGKEEDHQCFSERAQNYRNLFDTASGWMRPRDVEGTWLEPFSPYEYEHGFNEANGAQVTWFVPHDLQGLVQLMGGSEKAVEKLNAQFEAAEELGFTSGTSHARERHPEYSRIPINYGNQPSIQTAFVFNFLGRPDLSQYWSRKVVDGVYEGLQTSRGYNGDEDQGLMGTLAVLMKIGLFQMTGGTEEDPVYQIGSPVFDKVTIELNPEYYPGKQFVIEAVGNSDQNIYIENMQLNERPFENQHVIHHSDIVKGGKLTLEMRGKL